MDAKNKSNIKLLSIVASIMLLIIVVGASFAYFGTYKENIDKYKINITIDQFAKATFVTKDANLNLSVSKKDMVAYETGTKAAENSANLNVVLTSGNPNVKVTCTYDIYYEYDTNSSIYGVSPTPVTDSSLKELTLKALGSTGTNNYADEKNFNYDTNWTQNPYKRLIVKGASITDATKNGTTDTYPSGANNGYTVYYIRYGARPVISLSSKAKLTGSGTYNDVYTVVTNDSTEDTSSGKSFDTVFAKNNSDIFDENGLRYEGKDPNNYICLDNKTSGACSSSSLLFRIIGLFEEEYSSDGTTSAGTKKLLKILDTNNYGGTSGKYWNSAGTNNWSTASLKTELNGTYLTTLLGTSNVNSKLSSAIANTKWHLGGANDTSSSNYYYQKITTENWYKAERSPYATSGTLQNLYSGNPEYVFAKVGLMYPSDYGYATVGGSTTSKANCRAKELFNWKDESYSDCKNNDWVYNSQSISWGSNKEEWVISPYTLTRYTASRFHSTGSIDANYLVADGQFAVRPAFYLDSSILKIVGTGDGSSSNPYRIG